MSPPTAVAPARPEVVTEEAPRRRPAWVERATATDHKSVGLLYLGAVAVLPRRSRWSSSCCMRVQLIVPENTAIQPQIFDRVLSTFGVTAVVLFAIPLALGLISYVVPLQIGSRGVAFPRLNLLSFWLYLVGGRPIYGSFLYRPSEAGSRGAAAALGERLPEHARRRRLGRRHGAGGPRLRLLRGQPRGHAAQHARARHGVAARAAVLVGAGGERLPAAGHRPRDARGADHAVHRPPLRRACSSTRARAARRCSTSTSPGSSSRAPTCSCWCSPAG